MERTPILTLESAHCQQWQFSRYSYLEHPRPNHGLLLLQKGKMDFISGETRLQLKPLDLVFLPQGSNYEVRIHPGTEDLLLNFRILSEEALPQAPCLVTNDSLQTLKPLMEATASSCLEDEALEATGLFYQFCHRLTRMLHPQEGNDLMTRAKLLLSQPQCPDLETVAKQLLISPSGLRQKFKAAVGISPAQFRQQARVEQAKQLLLSTDLPAATVADVCGFCDSAYFHKIFCRFTGLTPTAYRNSHRQL